MRRALALLLLAALVLQGQQQQQQPLLGAHAAAPDPLETVRLLANCLYIANNVSCLQQYCEPSITVHGDGVWLPRAPFAGISWVAVLHRELFAEYSGWAFEFLEIAATAGAARGFSDVLGFFRWSANNTGSYKGLAPSLRVSSDYGIMHVSTDKAGKVTDVTIWRAGFAEEREVLPAHTDVISPMADVTQQPFWVPSKSLQLKMVEHAHALVQVLNQGAQFLDSLDDIAVPGVVLVDGMDIWGPQKAVGLTQLKLWLAGWLQLYDVNAAVTAMAATPSSNKVFLCVKLLLASDARALQLEGCLMYVFNIQGYITHVLVYRNGTPQEMAERFIGASSSSSGGRRSRSGGGGGLGAWRRRLWQQRERLRRRR